MPPKARKEIVDDEVIGVYHCYSRCVRRAFLCGQDSVTGNDYQHRRSWLYVRLQQLELVFMVEVLAYAILSNHFHTILRNRPDLAEKLSDREVARRSLMISPHSMTDGIELQEPKPEAIDAALKNKKRIRKWRIRLGSLSWFMKCLKEPIARRANREDQVTGKFWEDRFRSVRLLDEFAALTCSLYVDLNEIRAELAETPEDATNSSIGERIAAWMADYRERMNETAEIPEKRPPTAGESVSVRQREPAPPFIAPVNVASDNGTSSGTMTEEEPRSDRRRPSDSGYLPMTLTQYIELVKWAGDCARQPKNTKKRRRKAIPHELEPIMNRFVSNYDAFLLAVKNFDSLFRQFCGTPESLIEHGKKIKAKRMRGLAKARLICGSQ